MLTHTSAFSAHVFLSVYNISISLSLLNLSMLIRHLPYKYSAMIDFDYFYNAWEASPGYVSCHSKRV